MLNLSSAAGRRAVDKSVEKVDNLLASRVFDAVVGLFAKAPVVGQVKTRLCPPLQADEAARLYRVALDETIRRFSGAAFDLVICYAGAEDYFATVYAGLPRRPQRGADLGERMDEALRGFFASGYRKAVLIGSDSPDLPLTHIDQAFAALDQEEVVLAPAEDGGYVLIGESRHHPELFCEMPWSGENLMTRTVERLGSRNTAWRELPAWEDMDDCAALRRLLVRSPRSRTAGYVRQQFPQLFT